MENSTSTLLITKWKEKPRVIKEDLTFPFPSEVKKQGHAEVSGLTGSFRALWVWGPGPTHRPLQTKRPPQPGRSPGQKEDHRALSVCPAGDWAHLLSSAYLSRRKLGGEEGKHMQDPVPATKPGCTGTPPDCTPRLTDQTRTPPMAEMVAQGFCTTVHELPLFYENRSCECRRNR